jgi:ABC-type transport system involved in cytochrome bd biosynthesis fused ATPase/permease subunit
MDQLPLSPTYATWLLGQSVAVVLLVAWVISLHRALKRSYDSSQRLQTRNDRLSDSLADLVRSTSQERVEARESELRTVLESLEQALLSKPKK